MGTTVANMVIVPEKFAQYVIERTTKKSALIRSGIAVPNAEIATLINGTPRGGAFLSMPFYKPLSGDDEVFGEGEMTPAGITTASQIATLLIRQKAWSDTDLARVYGGDDPMDAVIEQVADWWTEKEQAAFVSILKGITGGATAALKDHVLDISAKEGENAVIGLDAVLDAKQLMGDAAGKLAALVMHSATYTTLQKKQEIETVEDSETHVKFSTYLGYEVIVDDDMPVDDGVYTTYLLGKGAFLREDGMPAGLVGVETERKALNSMTALINRRAFVLHPNGLSFNSGATLANNAKYASNADLAKLANWSKVAELKNIPIVALKHRIAPVASGNNG